MAKKISKKKIRWAIAGAAVVAAAVLGFWYWNKKKNALPEGLASGNGRLEAKLVDVAAKEPLRVKKILVDEGALVKPGQVLVQLDTVTLEAELSEAQARIAAAEQHMQAARASIVKQQSEINLARIEVDRSRRLTAEGAGSQRELDVRKARLETTRATLGEAQAMFETATEQAEAERANAARVQTRIDDAVLTSPVVGRVLYRLAEPGEVLGPGGKALTVVNLEDVYMEIFLPSEQAARLKLGSQARIALDYDPKKLIPGYVSFVSPEAQFTPKQVETKSEREKLMFRVKIQLPKDLAAQYVERIKTGIRGIGYVQLTPDAEWPEKLDHLIAQPTAPEVSTREPGK